MTDIANYDIKHTKNMDRLETLKEKKWEQMKTIKRALSHRTGQDNLTLSSLLNVYSMELEMEISETLKLIEILHQIYIKNEDIFNANHDRVVKYNVSREMSIIDEEIEKLKQNVAKLSKYKI